MNKRLFLEVYRHASLGERELMEIAKAHTRVDFCRDHLFLRQGTKSNAYYLLESGLAREFVSAED